MILDMLHILLLIAVRLVLRCSARKIMPLMNSTCVSIVGGRFVNGLLGPVSMKRFGKPGTNEPRNVVGPPFSAQWSLRAHAIAAVNHHTCVIAIHGVETRREDEHVEFILGAVRERDARLGDFRDGRLLETDDVDVLAVKLLVIPGVAERSSRVEVVRLQFPCLLGVVNGFADLLADEFARFLVGGLVGRDIAECPEHEAESIPLLPRFFEDSFPLFRRDAHGRDLGFLEPESDGAVAYLFPDLVPAGIDRGPVFLRDGAVTAGYAVLRRPLEAGQLLHFLGDRRYHLHARGAVADYADAFIREVVRLWPFAVWSKESDDIKRRKKSQTGRMRQDGEAGRRERREGRKTTPTLYGTFHPKTSRCPGY